MKCEICSQKIETIFLSKMLGTVVKDEKGKMHYICSKCQMRFENKKDKMLKEIK